MSKSFKESNEAQWSRISVNFDHWLALIACMLWFAALPLGAATLSLEQTQVDPNGNVVAKYGDGPGNATDWIGVYSAGSIPGQAGAKSLFWVYTNGSTNAGGNATDGSIWFSASSLSPGSYDVYLLENDGYGVLAGPVRLNIVEEASPKPTASASLSLNQTSVQEGSSVSVNYSGGPGNASDWIGIYRSGEVPGLNNSRAVSWLYANGTQSEAGNQTSGSVEFSDPELLAGNYDVYFLRDNGYDVVVGPVSLTIEAAPDVMPVGGPLTQDQISEMLEAHNALRREVGPMPDLRWADDLAQVAQEWADIRSQNCDLVHRQNSGLGENIYWAGPITWSSGKKEPQKISPRDVVIGSWGAEKADYDAANHTCSPTPPRSSCGHYTQIVWNTTTEVGCAMSFCPSKGQVWVCNYRVPGNMQGQDPF